MGERFLLFNQIEWTSRQAHLGTKAAKFGTMKVPDEKGDD